MSADPKGDIVAGMSAVMGNRLAAIGVSGVGIKYSHWTMNDYEFVSSDGMHGAEGFEYEPYGREIGGIREARFYGRDDSDTGSLIYNQFRYIIGSKGIYNRPDPIATTRGGIGGSDVYYYAGNNPVEVSDPLGLYQLHVNPNCCPGSNKQGSSGDGNTGGQGGYGECKRERNDSGNPNTPDDEKCTNQRRGEIKSKMEAAKNLLNSCPAAKGIFEYLRVYNNVNEVPTYPAEFDDMFVDNGRGPKIDISCDAHTDDPTGTHYPSQEWGKIDPANRNIVLHSDVSFALLLPQTILHEYAHFLNRPYLSFDQAQFSNLPDLMKMIGEGHSRWVERLNKKDKNKGHDSFVTLVEHSVWRKKDGDPLGWFVEYLVGREKGDYCAY